MTTTTEAPPIQGAAQESPAVAGEDPRAKLVALVDWVSSPDCALQLPGMLAGLVGIWSGQVRDKASSIDPAQLDRAIGLVQQLAQRVRDPSVSAADFAAWLPRNGTPGA